MPLINLTTDLKSLQYGNDRPGGGSSGLPYIVSPRPDQIVPPQDLTNVDDFTKFYELNRSTQDYPIRGGSIELDGQTGYPTTPAGLIDRSRIKAYMSDPQKGKIFLLKQTGLQLTNPKIQVPGTLGTSQILETTRVYHPNGRTTLAQVVTQGTGIHVVRHGLIPFYTGLLEGTYEDIVKRNNEEDTNRLSVLAKSKLSNDRPIYAPYVNKAIDYGISFLNNQILNYSGGPGSTYGIGETIVNRATNTNTSKVYNSIAFSYDTIMKQTATKGDPALPPEDFRQKINLQSSVKRQMIADYTKNGLEGRLSIGNPASPGLTRTNYKNTSTDTQDRLNTQNLFYYSTSKKPWDAPGVAKDMIKFVFECLSNDNPGNAVAIFFRSFLTSFTDTNQGEYNSFKYLGRGETFRTYQGFDRSISFGFKIAAFTRAEMKPLYTKLNHLVSQVYPDYSPQSKFMRGSVIKLTIGDYLYRVPGFIENVNITVDQTTSWEIALNDPEMRELPQVIDVQCSFKPIHNFLPRREKYGDAYVPLIADTSKAYLDKEITTQEIRSKNTVIPGESQNSPETFGPNSTYYYDPVTKTFPNAPKTQ